MKRITNAISDGDDIILEITEEIIEPSMKFCTGIGFYKSSEPKDVIKLYKKEHLTISKDIIHKIIESSYNDDIRCWYKGVLLETCNNVYPNIIRDSIVYVLDTPIKGKCYIKYGDTLTTVNKSTVRRID